MSTRKPRTLDTDTTSEIEQRLFFERRERMKPIDCTASLTPMCFDCVAKRTGTAVVQKVQSVRYSPQRRRPELTGRRRSLRKSICQAGSHVVQQEVGVGPDRRRIHTLTPRSEHGVSVTGC